MSDIKTGLYRHYKGKDYEVIGIGINTETLENFVIYKSLYDAPDHRIGTIWIRPVKMFQENVTVNGQTIPRFKYIGKVLI